jgi:DNA repair exonuclease SbcCD nuclease subunit
MTRVIHTGDTHVGYRQYHSPTRREDFLAAFESVVDDAVDGEVDALVHAGDLFHDRRPDLQDLLGVLSTLRRLDDAGVPFLAVVGNHEATRSGQWLDLFERLGLATRLGPDPTVVGDVAFYGLDFVPRSRREDLSYDFTPHDADAAALVSHGLFTPFPHADWDTETVLAASTVDFDAVLLGDNHAADTARVDDTWVTYCGSTERASAAERDGRGYNLVAFEDGEVDIRRRALDTRPFVFVTVDLAPGEGVERVREQVRQHDVADAVVVVDITGEGEAVTPAAVEEAATEAGALLCRVTDRREVDADSEVEVNFADPDAAVRERVAELGLSPAARDVDETVRASKVADSNVREEVKTRLQDRLDDSGAFAAATSAESDEDSGADEGTPPDDESQTPDGEGTPPDDESQTPDGEGTPPDDESQTPDGEGTPPDDESQTPDGESAAEDAERDADGQASMGDFA